MSTTYKVLTMDADLFTASLAQASVAVFERRGDLAGCIVDYGCPIQRWMPESVEIADAYYMRGEYEFRVPIIRK